MQGFAGHGENFGIYFLWDGGTGGYWAEEERDLTQVFTVTLAACEEQTVGSRETTEKAAMMI